MTCMSCTALIYDILVKAYAMITSLPTSSKKQFSILKTTQSEIYSLTHIDIDQTIIDIITYWNIFGCPFFFIFFVSIFSAFFLARDVHVIYSLRFSLIKILPEPVFKLGSTAGESSVLTSRLHREHVLSRQPIYALPNLPLRLIIL